jgi:hypothetical protein
VRWARTGARVTQKAWLEDNLTGLAWFVGVFVVLSILALVVQSMTG